MKNRGYFYVEGRAKVWGRTYALCIEAIEEYHDWLAEDYVDAATRKTRNRSFTEKLKNHVPRPLHDMHCEFLRAVAALPGNRSEKYVDRMIALDPPRPFPDVDCFSQLEEELFLEGVEEELVYWERMKRFSE